MKVPINGKAKPFLTSGGRAASTFSNTLSNMHELFAKGS
jgi:hypothetical protein